MNRKLTKQEKDWLIKGLEYTQTESCLQRRRLTAKALGKSVEIKPSDLNVYLVQIDNLRVVKICRCNEPDCHTINFQHWQRGLSRAISVSQIEDGRMLIVEVHKETNLLSGLEII